MPISGAELGSEGIGAVPFKHLLNKMHSGICLGFEVWVRIIFQLAKEMFKMIVFL